ncbi:MAG: CHRD domain-containing protein [Candidatus Woesebacteria bacterium]|nr:CHRD domain-containing protein [Candidatus Woesebacteria bacterium]
MRWQTDGRRSHGQSGATPFGVPCVSRRCTRPLDAFGFPLSGDPVIRLFHRLPRRSLGLGVAISLALLGGAQAADLKLSGDNEVLPVKTPGSGSISIAADGAVASEQVKSFKAGDLYVNVHGDANKGGEVRAQLTP